MNEEDWKEYSIAVRAINDPKCVECEVREICKKDVCPLEEAIE